MFNTKRSRMAAAVLAAMTVIPAASLTAPSPARAAVRYTTITVRFDGPEAANQTKVHLEHDTETTGYQQRSYHVWPEKTVQGSVVRFRVPTAQTHGLVLVYNSPRSTLATDANSVVIQTYKNRRLGAAITARNARNYTGKAAWGWVGTTQTTAVWHVGVTSKQVYTTGEFGQYGWKRLVLMYSTHNRSPIAPVAANWLPTYNGTVGYNGEPWVYVR